MKLRTFWIFGMVGLFSFARVADATVIGLFQSGTYAIWDTYSAGTTSFSNLSPSQVTPGISGGLSLIGSPGGEGFGGAGDLFSLTPGSAMLQVTGMASFPSTSVSLQIKMTTSAPSFFQPSLYFNANRHSPASTTVAGTGETYEGQDMYVITWTWNEFIPANTYFNFDFETGLAADVFLDAVAIRAVPEPATWASMAIGLGLLGGYRRISRRRQGA